MSTASQAIPIDAMVGSETTRSSSHSLYLFWLPQASDKQVKPEIGMDSAVRFKPELRKEWGKVSNAMLDRDGNVGGTWSKNRYTVREGTCLKVWGERTAWGTVAGKAALVLLCSKDAPVNRVVLPLSGSPTAAEHEAQITGQFWVLNRDDVEDHPEVPALTQQCAHYASPTFINEVFKVIEMVPAPEKAMAQKVSTKTVDTGDKVVAAGTHASGTITLRTRKGKRVMG